MAKNSLESKHKSAEATITYVAQEDITIGSISEALGHIAAGRLKPVSKG